MFDIFEEERGVFDIFGQETGEYLTSLGRRAANEFSLCPREQVTQVIVVKGVICKVFIHCV